MTELSPASRPMAKLSLEDRLYVIQTVNALPSVQFDELVFALNPPKGIIPPNTAPQGERSKALLDWVESPTGPGLAAIDQALQILIPTAARTAARFTAFAISGQLGDLSVAELEAIVQLLRKKTGDPSIDIAFYGAGSIKLVLSGSEAGLAQLQELFSSGELTTIFGNLPVESVRSIDNDTTEARKARFSQALRLQGIFHARTLAREIEHILAQNRYRSMGRARALASDINHELNFPQESSLTLTLDYIRELDRALNRTSDRYFNLLFAFYIVILLPALILVRTLTFESALLARAILGVLVITTTAVNFTAAFAYLSSLRLNRIRHLISDLRRELMFPSAQNELDLSDLDLSGLNLRNINLKKAILVGTNLSGAIVNGTIFGDNPGLTEAAKADLRQRGAIFQDSPGSNTPSLVG